MNDNLMWTHYIFCLFPGGSETPEERKYTIYIATSPGNYSVLNGGQPLESVNERYWKVNKPLEMFYVQDKEKEEGK